MAGRYGRTHRAGAAPWLAVAGLGALALSLAMLAAPGRQGLTAERPFARPVAADPAILPAPAPPPAGEAAGPSEPPQALRDIVFDPSVIAYQPSSRRIERISAGGADGASFVRWFADGHDESAWYRSDFDNEGHFMQVGWAAEHLDFSDRALHLWLTNRPSPSNSYTSAEYQKRGRYGHGRYEVVMRAARGSGLVSSFFTHTDSYFSTPHDEIDIEILGKDTRRAWLSWFAGGQTGDGVWHGLGFDAAADYHLYAFEWTPDTIRWFVDGVVVHERPDGTTPVPVTPGRIIINLWTGSPAQHDWHGPPDFAAADRASYQCISFRAAGDATSPQCSTAWFARP